MKLLILGHGRHGKDTAADLIAEKLGLKSRSSSLFAAERVIMPAMGYASLEACFNERHEHRGKWFTLITEYNTPDKSRLVRELLESADIYVGLRNNCEYEASKHLFDFVLWVDASDRVEPEPSTSFTITFNSKEMIKIDNNCNLDWLEKQINNFCDTCKKYGA